MSYIDQVRWFEQLGTCKCGKPATGTLRGPRNESYGHACNRCGNARVRAADLARDKIANEQGLRVEP